MSPGFAGIKEMGIYKFAEFYVSQLPITCLVYDNRGFGDSDTPAGQPKGEIVPMMQCSDISDAITFVSTKEEVDPERIGVWGSSYSGGHALYVGAVDRRVKVVIGQVPCTSGWDTFDRMSSPDALKALGAAFSQGTVYLQPASAAQILTKRQIAWVGGSPVTISVVESDASKPSALPTTDSYEYLSQWLDHPRWENKVTLKSYVPDPFIAIFPRTCFAYTH
jgi:pimeloyl-ACP methyl ester carboxylesterase